MAVRTKRLQPRFLNGIRTLMTLMLTISIHGEALAA